MSSASQALQERNRLLHNIYKYLPVGIELYNREGILIDMNDKEQEMFHLKQKEDLLGINIFENPIFPEEMKSKLRKHENADFTFRYDFSKIGNYYKTQKKTGTIDLVTKVTSLYDDNHNLTNYLLINADKTETTVAYNKIQEFESHFELIGDYAKWDMPIMTFLMSKAMPNAAGTRTWVRKQKHRCPKSSEPTIISTQTTVLSCLTSYRT